MQSCRFVPFLLICLVIPAIGSAESRERDLLEGAHVKGSSTQVTFSKSGHGIKVTLVPGKDDYPGVIIEPPGGAWRLSQFGHVEGRFVNTGTDAISLNLRLDNAGNWQDNPWNSESITVPPGQSASVDTLFGRSYGHKKAFALNPAAVTQVLIFTGKTDKPLSFDIESLNAGGPPNEQPPIGADDRRLKPSEGFLYRSSSPEASIELQRVPGTITVRPKVGRWDLSDSNEILVTLRNTGSSSTQPTIRIESNGGPSQSVVSPSAIPPGQAAKVYLPFFQEVDLNRPERYKLITSDAVSAIVIEDTSNRVEIDSIKAAILTSEVPKWLGTRPPTDGQWIKTLDDEFNGSSINPKVWKATGENYYDKVSHWTKQSVIVGNRVVKLRYQKQTGPQNDDPKQPSTPYASGYLDTYGLWTQKYGYFESRMKLPKAPGLWPAFWMMPERGTQSGPEQWKRMDTANGGMEFDIMEHLTRWGSYRYNIAMHYDGYQKDHKSLGSDRIYIQPDKDGFITCGLLWTPGSLEYFCNGKRVLNWENPRIASVPAMLMFTMPSGGWDNNDLDDAKLPSDLVIDYVRVWQRKDLVSH